MTKSTERDLVRAAECKAVADKIRDVANSKGYLQKRKGVLSELGMTLESAGITHPNGSSKWVRKNTRGENSPQTLTRFLEDWAPDLYRRLKGKGPRHRPAHDLLKALEEQGAPRPARAEERAVIKRPVDNSPDEIPTETGTVEETTPLTPEMDVEALRAVAELYRSGKLSQVIDWYEATKDKGSVLEMAEYRPMFRYGKERRNTGIAVSDLILERAVAKQKGDRARVGKSLSQLVEYLLWLYIGSPQELIEGGE